MGDTPLVQFLASVFAMVLWAPESCCLLRIGPSVSFADAHRSFPCVRLLVSSLWGCGSISATVAVCCHPPSLVNCNVVAQILETYTGIGLSLSFSPPSPPPPKEKERKKKRKACLRSTLPLRDLFLRLILTYSSVPETKRRTESIQTNTISAVPTPFSKPPTQPTPFSHLSYCCWTLVRFSFILFSHILFE